jgi:hypothetical protein
LGERPDSVHPRRAVLTLQSAEPALPCPRGGEAMNAEAIVRQGGAERGKGAGI